VDKTKSAILEFFYPKRTVICTRTFSNFLADYYDNVDHLFFITSLAARADDTLVTAAKTLANISSSTHEDKERWERVRADPQVTARELRRFARVLSRNLTNAIVSGFQRYFSEIIQATALKRPEILRSGQTVRVDEILRFTRHSDIVSYLIDKKINELSYGGIRDMESYFRDRLGTEMFSTDRQRALLTAFIEIRNINVHNGSIVNDLFLSKVGAIEDFNFVRGKRFHVDMDELTLLSDNAIRVALAIDRSVASKFKLQRKAHKAWDSTTSLSSKITKSK